jgi:hypothetical protein
MLGQHFSEPGPAAMLVLLESIHWHCHIQGVAGILVPPCLLTSVNTKDAEGDSASPPNQAMASFDAGIEELPNRRSGHRWH